MRNFIVYFQPFVVLLSYLLQNPRVKDKRLMFSLKSPFDVIANVNDTSLLPLVPKFRTPNWRQIERDLKLLLTPNLSWAC